MRRIFALSTACAASLLLLSCNGAQPTTPQADEAQAIEPVASLATRIDGADLLAGFHIQVDPETLTASVTPHRTGAAQPPQGQRYDLDIANFQSADSFRITGVQVLGSGNFRITFTHAHPFPAPNLANPASGSNRADLGYTGRLLILTTYNPQSYFSSTVRLSAGAVVGPDGYVETGDLLANTGPSLVTAYPYKLLADEAQDNRVGVSNGGDPEGSYTEAAGGWQRINLGASGTGWTGFDYVHGGQTVTNLITLSKESLAASNFALDVALLIQYQDPRGAGGSTFRFPPTVIDPLQFAYRLPYAALDCSRVTPSASGTIAPTVGASTTLEVRVRDWDATATEAADSKVGDEADVALVQAGGSGAPEVVLDAPGILAGLRNMGTPGSETGWSNDALLYSNTLPNQEGATAGTYYACLRITDPEFNDTARNTYHAGVDATTLLPDAARAVPARTWQIVPITVGPAVPVITNVSPTGIVGGVDEFVLFNATASGDPTYWSWDFGGGTEPNTSWGNPTLMKLGPTIGTFTGTVTATNDGGESEVFTFQYRVLPPQLPGWQHHNIELIGTGSGDNSKNRNMILYQGKPLVAMIPLWRNGPLRIARALVANPTKTSDWVIHDAVPSGVRFPAPFIFNNRLVVAYKSDNGVDPEKIGVAIAQVDVPDDASDWIYFDAYSSVSHIGTNCSGLDFHGRMVMIYEGFAVDHSLGCLVANTANPTSSASFDWHEIAADVSYPDMTIVSGDTDTRLLVAYADRDANTMSLRQSVPEFPSSAADWKLVYNYGYSIEPGAIDLVPYDVFPGAIGAIAAYVDRDNNVPALMFTNGNSSLGAQGVSRLYMLPGQVSNDDIDLVYLNGRLALLTGYGSALVVYRAQNTVPGPIDWIPTSIYPTADVVRSATMIASDNAFVVMTDETIDGFRYYGLLTSTGPW